MPQYTDYRQQALPSGRRSRARAWLPVADAMQWTLITSLTSWPRAARRGSSMAHAAGLRRHRATSLQCLHASDRRKIARIPKIYEITVFRVFPTHFHHDDNRRHSLYDSLHIISPRDEFDFAAIVHMFT